jgi:rare lipoprotein A
MKQEALMNWDKIKVRSKQLKNKIALQWGGLGNVGQKQALVKRLILAAFGTTLAFSGASADELGLATYYHNPHHGGLIAAHRTLSFGTQVRVHNLDNGRSAVVTVVDRGPFARGRIIDVSTVAADALGMRQAGVARVRLEVMQ